MSDTRIAQEAQTGSFLPPDGRIVEVSPWRRQLGWVLTVAFGYLGIAAIVKLFQSGKIDSASPAITLYLLVMIGLAVRLPLCGLLLEQTGVKLRGLAWTHQWSWSQIDHFELKERGCIPRLRIHLSDGKVKRVPGFMARSPSQEERCQALFRALEQRLEIETKKPSSSIAAV